MKDLKGKVAVVTGAGSGIGAATAALLARQGMKVVLADINEPNLEASVAKIKAEGGEAIGVKTDTGSFESMKNLAEKTYATFGAAHVVHLNAGISGMSSFFDEDTAGWERVTQINFLGVVWGIKAFVSRMIEGGEEGVILATSSGAGAEGTNFLASAYAATKLAVVSIMESLHGHLKSQESKIRSGLVFPPLAATRLAGEDPSTLQGVEAFLRMQGVPTVLVQPEGVAKMVLDGIVNDRFFIGVNERVSKECYDGVIGADFFEWSRKVIVGRSNAQLNETGPDAYLW